MMKELPCEACGHMASAEHIARRLRRLEWMTRYRPVHIQTLLLAGIAPARDAEYLYSPEGRFQGEAGELLGAVGIAWEGKSADEVLTEFQKRGLLLVHVLECPLEPRQTERSPEELLRGRVGATLARVRRSLKPKRVVLLSPEMAGVQGMITEAEVGVPVYENAGEPFCLPLEGKGREEFERWSGRG